MSRDQCHEFTSACLSSISKRYDDKVNYLFANYDYDNDGYIDLEGFLNFYEKASQDNKTATVWSNLKSFGVNADFRFPNEINKDVEY
jgi:Ca2+-binding EF-hand superfamily protein